MPQGSDNQIPSGQVTQIRDLAADRLVLAGICGAGMQSFCEMLRTTNSGCRPMLIGTDLAEDQLGALAETHPGLQLESWNRHWLQLLTRQTIVVHSVAVPPESPVLQAARERGCRVFPLPIALGLFVGDARQVCIAGTHGKTTTTGMVSWILQQARIEKTHYIGGEFVRNVIPHNSYTIGHCGEWAVLESCEYRDSFLSLTPEVTVLTGIEADHFDFFPTPSDQRTSFEKFVARSEVSGTLVVNHDCPVAMEIAQSSGRRIVTYSVDRVPSGMTSDWLLRPAVEAFPSCSRGENTRVVETGFGQQVALFWQNNLIGSLSLKVPGRHNRQNTLAAIAAAVGCGVSITDAAKFVETFPGMKRRFEYRGYWNQSHWIDDYAHHPTAISETLLAVTQYFPKSRIIVVIEPHQISRLNSLFENYVKSLALAAEVLVLPVLAARETASPDDCQRLSGQLVRAISESGGRAVLAANLDQAIGRLDHAARPGDVVITMGAGRTHKIHDEIHRRLQRNSAA